MLKRLMVVSNVTIEQHDSAVNCRIIAKIICFHGLFSWWMSFSSSFLIYFLLCPFSFYFVALNGKEKVMMLDLCLKLFLFGWKCRQVGLSCRFFYFTCSVGKVISL